MEYFPISRYFGQINQVFHISLPLKPLWGKTGNNKFIIKTYFQPLEYLFRGLKHLNWSEHGQQRLPQQEKIQRQKVEEVFSH